MSFVPLADLPLYVKREAEEVRNRMEVAAHRAGNAEVEVVIRA